MGLVLFLVLHPSLSFNTTVSFIDERTEVTKLLVSAKTGSLIPESALNMLLLPDYE